MVLLMRATSGFSIGVCHKGAQRNGTERVAIKLRGWKEDEEDEERRQAVVLMSMGEEARMLFKYLFIESAR